jgi:hypothetical protein
LGDRAGFQRQLNLDWKCVASLRHTAQLFIEGRFAVGGLNAPLFQTLRLDFYMPKYVEVKYLFVGVW